MSRDELYAAILELADSPRMRQHALERAMWKLDLEQLGELFDETADEHQLLHPRARRRVPRNPQFSAAAGRPVGVTVVTGGDGRRLCVHADDDDIDPHWLEPHQVCPYPRRGRQA